MTDLVTRLKEAIDYVELRLPGCPVKDCSACAERERQIAVLREAVLALSASREEVGRLTRGIQPFLQLLTDPENQPHQYVGDPEGLLKAVKEKKT